MSETSDRIEATFTVAQWDEAPVDDDASLPKVTRAVVEKEYAGDVTGTSSTQWLMAYGPDGSATFVGMERVVGTVGGREGTLVLQHVGTFADGAARADLTVVPGSGTGALEGATGSGDFVADPAGTLRLDLQQAGAGEAA